MISSEAGLLAHSRPTHGEESRWSAGDLRYEGCAEQLCRDDGIQRTQSASELRTPEGHEASMVKTGTQDTPRASRLDQRLLERRRAKKLPYRGDSKQAIAENLAHEPAEDGATEDGDAQDDDDNTG